MPKQQIIPIWGGLNNANSASATGLLDPVTGQQYNTGGLNVGDYFDLTEKEANTLSVTATGTCHSGRYRYVLVDSGATAANVKTGTVGYLRLGSFVQAVQTITAGSGQTVGSYTINADVGSGGGAGAVIQVVVGSGGTITGNPTVLNGGAGYVSAPTFSLTALGGSAGTIAVELNTTPNIVTSADQVAAGTAIPVRPVVFLNSITPGNYGFIQELGTATVLANSSVGTAAIGAYVNAVTTDDGVVTTTAQSGSPIGSTIGVAIDTPQNSILFKAQLGYACMTVQD